MMEGKGRAEVEEQEVKELRDVGSIGVRALKIKLSTFFIPYSLFGLFHSRKMSL